MRHGKSVAQEKGIFISNLQDGKRGFGLTKEGFQQVQETILPKRFDREVLIISSPFLRAIQTAEVVQKRLYVKKVSDNMNLRERFFGSYDKTSTDVLESIRAMDQENADHTHNGIESPNHVAQRLLEVIVGLERKCSDRIILLVAHGDPLSILQSICLGKSAGEHGLVPRFKNAEIRQIKFA